ncbi:MAG: universal stress protein [Bacteroidota bacterium]|nr:universal stress protein [Bacteroidota bacterium]
MYQLNNILVCLDLSNMDDFLIRYSNFLVEKFNPNSITFMHVMQSYEIHKDILLNFPDLDVPITKIVKDELEIKIDKLYTKQKSVETKVIVEEGVTTETIVQYSKKNNITLTLMGKKIGYKGKGSVVRKVLNITPSSVLLISETTRNNIDHVMVRIDFTKISEIALKMAHKIQERTGAKISCHHVYKLPLKYFPQSSLKDEKKLQDQVKLHSTKEFQKFVKKLKLNPEKLPFSCSLDIEDEEAHILYNRALTTGADIIIIGSKVKSELTDVILDSTSEKLAGTEKNIPVFVVKDRKQSMGFLNALFD